MNTAKQIEKKIIFLGLQDFEKKTVSGLTL
jgi:hypothetical protein